MRVAFLGLGRLGLPIASVLSQFHDLVGYDPAPSTSERIRAGHAWEQEHVRFRGELAQSAEQAADRADVVVVAVPTPHEPGLDGTHPTAERAPFDLSYVRRAVPRHGPPVVILSTLLPGDTRSLGRKDIVYSPQFIAMGTTVSDFLHPEFILGGTVDGKPSHLLAALFGFIDAPLRWSTWETAELTKMAYNTAVGLKLAMANTVSWLADCVGADGHYVMETLRMADRRITSPAYMRPGLGDGGACHPRDQIALSWLAREHGVYDLFGRLVEQRNAHSEWIAETARTYDRFERPPIILGSAYKPGTNLTDGSPALLLANQTGWEVTDTLEECHHRVVVIGCAHPEYAWLDLPDCIIIDPWGIVPRAVHPGGL